MPTETDSPTIISIEAPPPPETHTVDSRVDALTVYLHALGLDLLFSEADPTIVLIVDEGDHSEQILTAAQQHALQIMFPWIRIVE